MSDLKISDARSTAGMEGMLLGCTESIEHGLVLIDNESARIVFERIYENLVGLGMRRGEAESIAEDVRISLIRSMHALAATHTSLKNAARALNVAGQRAATLRGRS